jgi:hypothetical protein
MRVLAEREPAQGDSQALAQFWKSHHPMVLPHVQMLQKFLNLFSTIKIYRKWKIPPWNGRTHFKNKIIPSPLATGNYSLEHPS